MRWAATGRNPPEVVRRKPPRRLIWHSTFSLDAQMRNHTATQQRYTSLEDLLRERDIVVSRFIMGAVAAWGAIDRIDNALLFPHETILLLAGDEGRFELVRWERETEDFPPDVKNIQLEAFGTAAIESVVVRPDPNPTLRL